MLNGRRGISIRARPVIKQGQRWKTMRAVHAAHPSPGAAGFLGHEPGRLPQHIKNSWMGPRPAGQLTQLGNEQDFAFFVTASCKESRDGHGPSSGMNSEVRRHERSWTFRDINGAGHRAEPHRYWWAWATRQAVRRIMKRAQRLDRGTWRRSRRRL